MLRLSKKSDYGLIALKHIASQENGKVANAKQIARKYGLPLDLLAKVLQNLSRSGILSPRFGSGGGYRLAKKPSDITLKDVIQSIDGPVRFLACYSGNSNCSLMRRCTVRKSLREFEKKLSAILETLVISDI